MQKFMMTHKRFLCELYEDIACCKIAFAGSTNTNNTIIRGYYPRIIELFVVCVIRHCLIYLYQATQLITTHEHLAFGLLILRLYFIKYSIIPFR